MPLSGFEKLLDAMPSARVMTISPHLEAKTQYARMKALLNRQASKQSSKQTSIGVGQGVLFFLIVCVCLCF